MPFASEHYPHENKTLVERRYPGDFITEYIAQTRTWFYYMHAMGVLLFDAPSFKNCVTTGTLLASDGAKISKSKKNFTDPYVNIDLYGADAMRFYMVGSVVMSAEDAAFKDDELREAHNRFINMIWNSYKFYEMNVGTNAEKISDVKNLTKLDEWVLARLGETVQNVTRYMDGYDSIRSARALREFVTDLSTWYIRRSRDRFKSEDADDGYCVRAVSREVFLTLAKLIAPLTPYIAESVYRGVGGKMESVHLEEWPANSKEHDLKIIEAMAEIRRLASVALEIRQRSGVKVRQPLAKIMLAHDRFTSDPKLLEILLDEINVKACEVDTSQKEEVVLDTELTEALRQEGAVRDIVRAVQDMRKKACLMPEDVVSLILETDTKGKEIIEVARTELSRVAGVKDILFSTPKEGSSITIGESTFLMAVAKK
jgi:isoleucyl-tRNA synthetase